MFLLGKSLSFYVSNKLHFQNPNLFSTWNVYNIKSIFSLFSSKAPTRDDTIKKTYRLWKRKSSAAAKAAKEGRLNIDLPSNKSKQSISSPSAKNGSVQVLQVDKSGPVQVNKSGSVQVKKSGSVKVNKSGSVQVRPTKESGSDIFLSASNSGSKSKLTLKSSNNSQTNWRWNNNV